MLFWLEDYGCQGRDCDLGTYYLMMWYSKGHAHGIRRRGWGENKQLFQVGGKHVPFEKSQGLAKLALSKLAAGEDEEAVAAHVRGLSANLLWLE